MNWYVNFRVDNRDQYEGREPHDEIGCTEYIEDEMSGEAAIDTARYYFFDCIVDNGFRPEFDEHGGIKVHGDDEELIEYYYDFSATADNDEDEA